MSLWRCRGCEVLQAEVKRLTAARDAEVERLVHLNNELLNRCLAVNGQVPLAPQVADDEPDDATQAVVKTVSEMDKEAQHFLESLAQARGLKVEDFADA